MSSSTLGTPTFLMTDIEGSTVKWERHGSAMRAALARHDFLAAEVVNEFCGQIVKQRGEGDSLFIVFQRATDAAWCAIEICRLMKEEDWGMVGPMRLRMAIHTGEAEFRHNDYYGSVINRCARIKAAAHGGQILVSYASYLLIKDSLPPGAKLVDLGDHLFKDLIEPEHVYMLVGEGLEEDFGPIRSLSAKRHNLPVELSSFIGRESEIQYATRTLKDSRLLTLSGAGGSGKTRLALQVAARLVDSMTKGVWFSSLVDLRDEKLVARHLASCLPVSVGQKDPIEAVVEEFADSDALIVLDNCEHLLKEAAAVIHKLLVSCPNLKILATTRELLSVSGEIVYLVPTMSYDLGGAAPTLENIGNLEAVRLLRERAAGHKSGSDILTEENKEAVLELVRRLGGIPLALEQAAANLVYFSPQQLVDRLERRFKMRPLTGTGFEERQKTIENAIDSSFQMLSDEQRRLFTGLSIFDGGASLEAIEYVCSQGPHEAALVFDPLQDLVSRSLLIAEDLDDQVRFRMLEPIREFAEARRSLETEPQLKSRHFEWFRQLALQASLSGLDAKSGFYMRRLDQDYQNVRSALRWATGREELRLQSLEFCTSLEKYWIRRAHIREGAAWLQAAIELAPMAPMELKADSYNKLGALMYYMGNGDAAVRAFEVGLQYWREIGNEIKIASGINNLAILASQQGRHEDAKGLFLEAAALFRAAQDQPKLANCLQNLAVTEGFLDDLESMVTHLEEAYELFKGLDLESDLAHVIQNLLGGYAYQRTLSTKAWLLKSGLELVLKIREEQAAKGMLEVTAAFALEKGEQEYAAELLGSASKAGERSDATFDERAQQFVDFVRAKVTDLIGENRFYEQFKTGCGKGTWEAVKDALEYLRRIS